MRGNGRPCSMTVCTTSDLQIKHCALRRCCCSCTAAWPPRLDFCLVWIPRGRELEFPGDGEIIGFWGLFWLASLLTPWRWACWPGLMSAALAPLPRSQVICLSRPQIPESETCLIPNASGVCCPGTASPQLLCRSVLLKGGGLPGEQEGWSVNVLHRRQPQVLSSLLLLPASRRGAGCKRATDSVFDWIEGAGGQGASG